MSRVASRACHLEVAQVLEHGADSEGWNSMDWWPFERASFGGHVELEASIINGRHDIGDRNLDIYQLLEYFRSMAQI